MFKLNLLEKVKNPKICFFRTKAKDKKVEAEKTKKDDVFPSLTIPLCEEASMD